MGWENDVVEAVGLPLGAFLAGFIGGLIPIFNVEAIAVILAATTGEPLTVALGLSAGQMSAYMILYGFGAGSFALKAGWFQRRREAAMKWLEERNHAGWPVIASAALFGIPPFYIVSIAAGVLKFRWTWMVGLGLPGRIVHFAFIAYTTEFVGSRVA